LTLKNKANDYMLINGNCEIKTNTASTQLVNGILEIKGNFTQIGNYGNYYVAGPSHKTIFSGKQKHYVSFEYPNINRFYYLVYNRFTEFLTSYRAIYQEMITDICEHDYVGAVTKAATCAEAGEKTHTCSICGDNYKETIPINPAYHSGGTYESVITAATYEADGLMGIYCSGCNAQLSTRIIEKLTCVHDYTSAVTKTATCAEAGEKTYTCSKCGDSYKETIPINPAYHSGGTVEKVIKPATFTEEGEMGIHCADCDKLLETRVIPIQTCAHEWNAGVITTPSTCIKEGVKTFTCTVPSCGETKTEAVPVDPDNHSGGTVEKVIKPATFTEEGEMGIHCADCDKLLDTRVIPIQTCVHEWNAGIITTPSTCIKEGVKTFTCTVPGCGETKTETVPVDPDNHTGSTIEKVIKPATFTEEGEMGIYCADCDKLLETRVIPIQTCAHEWNAGVITKPSTCIKEGVKTFTCTVPGCGETKTEAVPINSDNHTNGTVEKVIKPATFTEEGEMGIHCADCDKLLGTRVIPIQTCAHEWNAGVITTPSTCITEGVKTFTCTVPSCGETKTEAVPINPDNHTSGTVEKVIKPATFTEEGEMGIHCADCDKLLDTRVMPILVCVHVYVDVVTKAATCAEAGEKTYSCSECGDYYTEIIAKLSHQWVSINIIAPTETTYGYTLYKCQLCNEEKEDDIIPPTGQKKSDAEFLMDLANGILQNGLSQDNLKLNGKVLTL